MNTSIIKPSQRKWPFAPKPPKPVPAEGKGWSILSHIFHFAFPKSLLTPFTLKFILGDLILVLAWGAMIPIFLWLGFGAGF